METNLWLRHVCVYITCPLGPVLLMGQPNNARWIEIQ